MRKFLVKLSDEALVFRKLPAYLHLIHLSLVNNAGSDQTDCMDNLYFGILTFILRRK